MIFVCVFVPYWIVTFTAIGVIVAYRCLGDQRRIWRYALASPISFVTVVVTLILGNAIDLIPGWLATPLALTAVFVALVTPLIAIVLAISTPTVERRGFPVTRDAP